MMPYVWEGKAFILGLAVFLAMQVDSSKEEG